MTLLSIPELQRRFGTPGKKELQHFSGLSAISPHSYNRYTALVYFHKYTTKQQTLISMLLAEIGVTLFPLNDHIWSCMKQEELEAKVSECRCLMVCTKAPYCHNLKLTWLLGYCAAALRKILLLPVFQKDTNELDFPREGIFSNYPYAGIEFPFGESKETLWIMNSSGDNNSMNIEYWLNR